MRVVLLLTAIFLIIVCIFLIFRKYRIHLYAWYIRFPKPKYALVIEKNVMVSMKDGTRLATDIYRPNSRWKFPVILIRTPYDKSGQLHSYKQLAELFASQGYVVIVQDVRGKFASEGGFYPYAYEALDGQTTLTWAGEASWSSGKIAIWGISYLGTCAWLAARYKSPYLCTIVPMFTTQDTYSIWIDKGIPFLKGPLFWLGKYGNKKVNERLTAKKLEPVLWQLPVNILDTLAVKHEITFFRDYLSHTTPDSFWKEISADHSVEDLNLPAFIFGGWYDPFLRGTIEDYQRLIKAPSPSKNHSSRMVIGPWAHNPSQKFKTISFGKNADFNSMLHSTLQWFDCWLKDISMSRDSKKIKYFIMGSNEWKETDQWPPSNVVPEKYFLSLNSLNYTLSPSSLSEAQKCHFFYNPRDPVLFRGDYLLDGETWIEPIEQKEILSRNDVLFFTTPPLQEDLTIAGTVTLHLYVSSQSIDTDFCAKICDMHPNGKTYNITPGFIRMRYRESLEKTVWMVPNEIYPIEISFRPSANTFLKDHRIQLQITSSDFPVHARNLNTGLNCETSIEIRDVEQTVYFGGPYESYLSLPVMKNI